MPIEILKGPISPETAYVVEDYPYGYKLRCKIRYWVEFKPTHGFRMVCQTTNPRKPGECWNKPKAGIYSRFGGCLYLNENRHVMFTGLSEYSSGEESKTWADTYGEGVPEAGAGVLRKWVASKLAYDSARKPGDPLLTGIREASEAFR